MRVAVLALQGAFREHIDRLKTLNAEAFEVRQTADWFQSKDALILPGGESTTQRRLLQDLALFDPIRKAIQEGLPVLGTCAGMILLSDENGAFSTMDISVERNAYGRQLGSFRTEGNLDGVGNSLPMTFIRAPRISRLGAKVQPLGFVDGRCVAARQGRQVALAFHPELDDDLRLHQWFLQKVCQGEA